MSKNPQQPQPQKPVQRMSSQMEAVVRLMTGKEERTIADKLADPNRPTWEQYKKDNQDKLNLSSVDQKKMEAYRQELDAQRDAILARGTNHGGPSSSAATDAAGNTDKKKKKSKKSKRYDSDDSDDDSSTTERRKRKHRKKRKKKHKRSSRHHSSEDDSSEDNSSEEERERRKKKKRKKSKKKEESGGDAAEDNRYRLSNFFTGTTSD